MQMHNTRSRVYIGLGNIILAISTVFFSHLIDNVFMGSVQVINLIVFILSCIVGFLCLHFYALEKIRLVDKIKKNIINSYFYFPQNEKDETRISKIFENDVLYCVEYENYGVITFITNLIAIVIFGTYIYVISPIFLITLFIVGLLQTCIPHYFGMIFSKNYLNTLEIEEKIEEVYYDIFSNFKKTWFFRNDYFIKRIHQYNVQYYHVGAQSEKNAQVYKAVIQMVAVISQFGLCFIGLIVMQISDFSLSELLIILLLGNQILSMFISEIDIIKNRKMYDVSRCRIDEIIKVNSESKVVKDMCKEIVFNNYHPSFLDYNISFAIQQNDIILVKGKNGGGKSTIIKSLLNLMTDYSGEIIIDD